MRQAAALAAFALLIKFFFPKFILAQGAPTSRVNVSGPNRICDLQATMEHIITNVVVPLAAIVLFVMLIAGGIQYLTSGGDPKSLEQAKNTLTYAIAGIALLVLAWFVLYFIEVFTGVRVTLFSIPCPSGSG